MANTPDNKQIIDRQREILMDDGFSRTGANILLLSSRRYMLGHYQTTEQQEDDIANLIKLVRSRQSVAT